MLYIVLDYTIHLCSNNQRNMTLSAEQKVHKASYLQECLFWSDLGNHYNIYRLGNLSNQLWFDRGYLDCIFLGGMVMGI
jgi:hypothetical protein